MVDPDLRATAHEPWVCGWQQEVSRYGIDQFASWAGDGDCGIYQYIGYLCGCRGSANTPATTGCKLCVTGEDPPLRSAVTLRDGVLNYTCDVTAAFAGYFFDADTEGCRAEQAAQGAFCGCATPPEPDCKVCSGRDGNTLLAAADISGTSDGPLLTGTCSETATMLETKLSFCGRINMTNCAETCCGSAEGVVANEDVDVDDGAMVAPVGHDPADNPSNTGDNTGSSTGSSRQLQFTLTPDFISVGSLFGSALDSSSADNGNDNSDGNNRAFRAVIGAPTHNDNRGMAWIFVENKSSDATIWTLEDTLTPSELLDAGSYGCPVAMSRSGNTAVVSFYDVRGCASVFERTNSSSYSFTWNETQQLIPDDDTGYFGLEHTLTIDDNVIVVGTWKNGGAVYVFSRSYANGNAVDDDAQYKQPWSQIAKFNCFEEAVAIQGDSIIAADMSRGDGPCDREGVEGMLGGKSSFHVMDRHHRSGENGNHSSSSSSSWAATQIEITTPPNNHTF